MAKTLKLYTPRREIVARPRETRGTRHERGYDSAWDRRSARYRASHPICVECERKGIIVVVDVVDHKIPVADRPDLRLDPKNWWSLCTLCHNGIKRRMENYARKANMVDQLQLWCDDPESRPAGLKTDRVRKVKEEMVV